VRRVLLPSNAVVGDSPRLTGALHHHLGHVLRLRPGARLLLVEESGVQHLACVVAITADAVELAVEERWPAGPVPQPRLTLVYGLSRRARTEWVLQKATELGIDRLQLALCVRSVSQPEGDRKLERWREIIRQAARQCRRDHLPELEPAAPLAVALQRANTAEVKLLAHPDGEPLAAIEERLAPFEARPHWGKLFGTSPEVVRGLYERHADFVRLTHEFDPAGKFRNELMGRYFPR
jgi:16S rRNA (uracil1498-N3)-methyltransferase